MSLLSVRTVWFVLAVAACAGCRSQVGAVYDVATGRTTGYDVAPPRMGGASRVEQASFDPPQGPNAVPPSEVPSSAVSQQPDRPERGPQKPMTREEAIAAVQGDLQSAREHGAEAEQELLRRLLASEPAQWDLVAKQFRTTLAYHNQMRPAESVPTTGRFNAAPASHSNVAPLPRASFLRPQSPPSMEPAVSEPGLHPITPPADGPRQSPAPYPTTGYTQASSPPSPAPLVEPPYGAVQLASVTAPASSRPAPVEPAVYNAAPMNPQGDWRAALDEARALLESHAPADPHSTAEAYLHARERLLALAAGDLEASATPIPGLSPTEQDFWSKQLYAIATLLDNKTLPETNRRAAAAGLHLAKADMKLKQISSLSVRNLTFCEEVLAYGSYTQRTSRKFRAGERTVLYVEVENYRTESTKKGLHTVIGSSYRILDKRGTRVDGREFPALDDYCLSRRRDFHINYGVSMPERIYPGEYQLELTLTDQLGDKIGRASIDFEIVDELDQ